jgi:hypothetical protein
MYALKVIIMGFLSVYESTCEFSVFKERQISVQKDIKILQKIY